MKNYHKAAVSTQREQDRSDQVLNNAGGYVFEASLKTKLTRFLIMGASQTHYTSERDQMRTASAIVTEALDKDPSMFFELLQDVSLKGRARKQDETLYALAMAASHSNVRVRQQALALLPAIARTGTHLFTFLEYVNSLRGWGRALKKAVASWYDEKPAEKLAFQALKYRQRNGWSHRDALRLAHPKQHPALYSYLVKKEMSDELPETVFAFERVQSLKSAREIVAMVEKYKMPWEFIPTDFVNDPLVLEALAQHMPMGALLRNLSRLAKADLLKPLSNTANLVSSKFQDAALVKGSRLHPLQILEASMAYQKGVSTHGHGTWVTSELVVDALEDAFYSSFEAIEPTRKPTLLGIDVSASMGWGGQSALTPRKKAAVMAMVTARSEPNYHIMGFSHKLVPINITAKDSLQSVIKTMSSIPMGRTDCALPMIYAEEQKLGVDNFAVYTDNETWYGAVHPYKALKSYRKASGRQASLAVVAFENLSKTIADPQDAGMMDFAGFDSSGPALMAEFFRGDL